VNNVIFIYRWSRRHRHGMSDGSSRDV